MKYSSRKLPQEFPLLSLVSLSYKQKQLFFMYAYSEVASISINSFSIMIHLNQMNCTEFQHTATVVLPILPVSVVIESNAMSNLIELQSCFHKQLLLGVKAEPLPCLSIKPH